MSIPVVLRDDAQAEFYEAFDYYERQPVGLGVEFMARGQHVFDHISENPRSHAIVLGDVRKAVVKRFPYCIFFRPHTDRVEVIAVFHSSRDPSVWQGRA